MTSTRPEPQVGQTWIADRLGGPRDGQVVTVLGVDTKHCRVFVRWPCGTITQRESSMALFSPSADTLAQWNQNESHDLAVEILRLEDLPPPLPARAVKQAELGVKLARLVLSIEGES